MKGVYLGANIAFLRKKNKLQQSEIQDRLGFKRNTWSNWENGISEPSLEIIVQIADFFKISVEDLIKTDLSNVQVSDLGKDQKNGQNVQVNVKDNVQVRGQNQAISVLEDTGDSPYLAGENALLSVLKQQNEILQSALRSEKEMGYFLKERIEELKEHLKELKEKNQRQTLVIAELTKDNDHLKQHQRKAS